MAAVPGLAAVAALLLQGTGVDAVREAFEDGALRGDDWPVLGAWALRRSGGESSSWLRASRTDLLAGAGISGAALRVVDRLESARRLEP
jgi:hypothetical protein